MSEPLAVSHKVLTVPNVLSVVRLLLIPVFVVTIYRGHEGIALAVLMLSGITDYADGKIARHYGLVTRLGQLLDPLADRLFIVSTLLGLAWAQAVPWWWVALILGRELVVASFGIPLATNHLTIPPVHFIGKAATLCLLLAFPLLLGSVAWTGTVATTCAVLGWACAWWGTGLYFVGAAVYAWQVADLVHRAKAVARA